MGMSTALRGEHIGPSDSPNHKPRNMKNLSLPIDRPRRPSVLSLPSLSNTHDEDRSPSVPYADGPVQVLPRIWLGSEDNARDWHALRDRGISAVLNVAKEVPSPFDAAHPQPLRPFASTPLPVSHPRPSSSTYYPPHPPSGRPAMHYLKLSWSHGQRDLVAHGFPTAMAFIDAALQRNQGILIQYVPACSHTPPLTPTPAANAAYLAPRPWSSPSSCVLPQPAHPPSPQTSGTSKVCRPHTHL